MYFWWNAKKKASFYLLSIKLVFCQYLLKVDPILVLNLLIKLFHFNTLILKKIRFLSHSYLLFEFHKLCITFLPIILTLQFDGTNVVKAAKYSWLLLMSRHLSIHPTEHSSLYFIVTIPSFSFDILEWPLLNFLWLLHTNV